MKTLWLSSTRGAGAVCAVVALCCFSGGARAQWLTESFTLEPGFNGIYLSVDASHQTIDELMGGRTDIDEIWRWNPSNPEGTFIDEPADPETGVEEWSVWRRGDPANSTITRLYGGFAYLVSVGADSPVALDVQGQAQVPSYTWHYNGLNLFGFPVETAEAVTFANYFQAAPALAQAETYKYVGGPLGETNPVRVFNKSFETLERGRAYWIKAEQYSDFYGPVRVHCGNGLRFGRTTNIIALFLANLEDTATEVTLTAVPSESAPAGQAAVAGDVPLAVRGFHADAGTWSYEPIPTEGHTLTLAPGQGTKLNIAVQRVQMTADPESVYQSILRVTDDGGLTRIDLPVSAEVDSPAGLWIGEAVVDRVQNQLQRFEIDANGEPVQNPDGSYALDPAETDTGLHATAQTFPLRLIMHVDDGGNARLLSTAYVGVLASNGEPGVTDAEATLDATTLADAVHVSAAHLPPGPALMPSAGDGFPASLEYEVTLGYTHSHNPFVHQFHPLHDNRDARFETTLAEGRESWDITRTISLTFTTDASAIGVTHPGWGSTVVGGTYVETIDGLHKNSITNQGTFVLTRVAEYATFE